MNATYSIVMKEGNGAYQRVPDMPPMYDKREATAHARMLMRADKRERRRTYREFVRFWALRRVTATGVTYIDLGDSGRISYVSKPKEADDEALH